MGKDHWTAGLDFTALPRDGVGLVFNTTDLINATLIPLKITTYACSWAIAAGKRPTEGHHGDGNHHGPEHRAAPG